MNRILLRAPNWIGDQVLAYPFYSHLRKVYPQAWIGVVCTGWVADIQFRGLIDEVFVFHRSKNQNAWNGFLEMKNFANSLRSESGWDLGIAMPNSFGAALLLWLAGAKNRRGYSTDARSILLNQKIPWDASPEIHRSQAYLNLLTEVDSADVSGPNYWKSFESRFDPIHQWSHAQAFDTPQDPYFIIAPGATADSRRWPYSKFVDLIRLTQERHGLEAVIVGGAAEQEIAAQMIEQGVRVQDYTGKGSVSAHWKLFQKARFTVCNESGLAHVAALCGSPVQIVCGAADPKRTQPIGPARVSVLTNPVECWPCERNVCAFEDQRKNQCLMGITPDAVLKEIEREFL